MCLPNFFRLLFINIMSKEISRFLIFLFSRISCMKLYTSIGYVYMTKVLVRKTAKTSNISDKLSLTKKTNPFFTTTHTNLFERHFSTIQVTLIYLTKLTKCLEYAIFVQVYVCVLVLIKGKCAKIYNNLILCRFMCVGGFQI